MAFDPCFEFIRAVYLIESRLIFDAAAARGKFLKWVRQRCAHFGRSFLSISSHREKILATHLLHLRAFSPFGNSLAFPL